MVSDKPTGLKPEDFLSKTLGGCRLQLSPAESDKFGGFGQASDLSESEVTSSILKGHDNMMAVLTARGRNIEIIRKLWQGKVTSDQSEIALQVINRRNGFWTNLCTCVTYLK